MLLLLWSGGSVHSILFDVTPPLTTSCEEDHDSGTASETVRLVWQSELHCERHYQGDWGRKRARDKELLKVKRTRRRCTSSVCLCGLGISGEERENTYNSWISLVSHWDDLWYFPWIFSLDKYPWKRPQCGLRMFPQSEGEREMKGKTYKRGNDDRQWWLDNGGLLYWREDAEDYDDDLRSAMFICGKSA